MLTQLNEQQTQAVNLGKAHGLVLAGAGSGKTFTIIQRVASLLDDKVPPNRILVLTFTKKAAQELVDRLAAFHKDKANEIEAGTFHRFCLNAIRRNTGFFGDISKYRVLDRDDQLSIIKDSVEDALKPYAKDDNKSQIKKSLPTPSSLLDILSYSRSTCLDIDSYIQKFYSQTWLASKASIIKQIFSLYHSKKKAAGYLDFDDILIEFSQKLAQDEVVRSFFKQKYDHILVDEFQDTNIIQWNLLESMVNPSYIYCVGDDAQSIYSFRGANLGNLTKFKNLLKGFTQVKLTINYRSTQRILNLANHVLAESILPYDKKLTAARHLGKKPVLKDFYYSEHEAAWLAKDIIDKKNSGILLSDMMVMVRSAWLSRPLQAILVEQKIPFRFIGGVSLFKSAHVKALLVACQAATNFYDEVAWLYLLKLFPKIGPKNALSIFNKLKALQSNQAVLDYFATKFSGGLAIFNILKAVQITDKPDFLLTAISEALSPILEKQNPLNWPAKQKDLDLIINLAKRFDSVDAFIDAYSLDPISQSEADNKAVKEKLTLITIHSAKGLESKICYLIQAQKGTFPHFRSETEEQIEEERRVLYVALTRAKDELIITRALSAASKLPINNFSQRYFLTGLEYKTDIIDYQPPVFHS